ncbi:MAG: ribonuclease R [Bacteroidetes bacterium]|nr:ribonuclease R [Bacteroidota bacterium]
MKKEIKSFFKKNPGLKLKAKDIAKKLFLTKPHEYAKLKEFLFALKDEGYLNKAGKRYYLNRGEEIGNIGTFHISKEGTFGFVIMRDETRPDIFIPEKFFGVVLNGDTVEVAILSTRKGKSIEGKIERIVERKIKEVTGTLKKIKNAYFVFPEQRDCHRDIYVAEENLNDAVEGDKVVVDQIKWEIKNLSPEGRIAEVLGKEGFYDTEIAYLAREFNLPYQFPEDALAQTELIPEEIPEDEIKRRIDFRDKNVFTIDPEDAKDFDDAVSIEEDEEGNFNVGIHIADVSHYIPKNSELFEESLERGNSVYFVGKVIPMLPEKLSNKICSLVPNEDRLTYSVLVKFSSDGRVLSHQIKKTIINSKRRFTYEEVQNIIEKGNGELYWEISRLNKFARILRKNRTTSGSINFISPEVKFELSPAGVPLSIKLKVAGESNNLIEELMLLANRIVAEEIKILSKKEVLPFVYRVHDQPNPDKLSEFSGFVKSLGYKFNLKAKNKSKEFQRILEEAAGTAEESVVNVVAIRSMAKADYSTNNIGHYGLGFLNYTHFTSPIRRFPDLIAHKLIYNYLENDEKESYSLKELERICEQTSERERNAISAERMSVKLKQIEFLNDKIGEIYEAIISGVAHFGIFVEITENLAEGLIRFKDLEDDFYEFDDKSYSITGKHSRRTLRLGDKIKVKLIRADRSKRQIDFMFLEKL